MDYELYIQVQDEAPVNHPATKVNLVEAFGLVPNDWEPFVRVINPSFNNGNIVLLKETSDYLKVDGVWTDVWQYREKTIEELAAEKKLVVDHIKYKWATRPYAHNFVAWTFNEEKMIHQPPIPRPDDGNFYRWYGAENRWRIADPFPDDGKQYYFDFDNWVNVEITDV